MHAYRGNMWVARTGRQVLAASVGHLIAVGVTAGFAFAYGLDAIGGFRYPEGRGRLVVIFTVLLPLLAMTLAIQLTGLSGSRAPNTQRASLIVVLFGWFVVVVLAVTSAALILTRQKEDCILSTCVVFPAPWTSSLYWAAHLLIGAWFLTLGLTWAVAGRSLGLHGSLTAGALLILSAVGLFIPVPILLSMAYALAAVANLVLGLGFAQVAESLRGAS